MAEQPTEQQLRAIAMKGVKARMEKMTHEERSEQASRAAKAANAKRWAGHVKADYNERRRKWRRRPEIQPLESTK